MGIFKTYDIRGIYGKEINTDTAYRVGRAFVRFLKSDSYMVGYDARLHSKELYQSLIDGILDEGKDVCGIGMVSTPLLHFSQIKGGFGGGVMVTASHNPPEYHGFKLYDGQGGSVSYSKGLNEIERIVKEELSDIQRGTGSKGNFNNEDTLQGYIDFLKSKVSKGLEGMKLVIDPSNGSSGRVFESLIDAIGVDGTVINGEPDGRFPAHGPNPLKPESSADISAKIRETGADFGAILDGDGDRVLFVDERGQKIENYFLSSLIAEELLEKQPGASIVYDLIASRVLPERIEELGGRAIVSRVGYTFLYDEMVRNGAIFGSETSGHVYFKVTDTYYTESAAYAVVTLMNLLQKKGKRLSELIEPLVGRYYQSGEINVEIERKEDALKLIEQHFSDGEVSKLDGISVAYNDVWFNVRPSNTEPVLRIRLEGRRRETVESKKSEILNLVKQVS